MSSPISKIIPLLQAPVLAAKRALSAPDLSDSAVFEPQDATPGGLDLLRGRLRRPMLLGSLTVLFFVILAGIWASVTKIEGAVIAQGAVRSEFNRRTLRQRDGGVVSGIYVREGQRVKAGQTLIQLAPTQSQAMVDVMRNQVDSAAVRSARFEAEMTGKGSIAFSSELLERAKNDPQLANLMRDQQFVFNSRRALIRDQRGIYLQQIEQLKARIGGLGLQIKANEESSSLLREQLRGYQSLYEKGFAPRTVLLNLQRTLSDLGGQRGANIAEVTRTQEQIGEVNVNVSKLNQSIQAEAAEGLTASQVALADTVPRLRAAEESLQGTTVRSPVDGYVFGLTQFTVGSAVGSGERLMDIVPANEPLIIEAQIKPSDIDNARVGQRARVTLSAYDSRNHAGVDGEVIRVSPDMIEAQGSAPIFRVDVRVTPEALAEAGNKDVKLAPGMPASVMLLTGRRSIMTYLTGPFFAPLAKAFKEE